MKVFSNHSGTTSNTYRIGKRGVDLIVGEGEPDFGSSIGSLYFRTDVGLTYQMMPHGWEPLATQTSVQMSMTIMASTIEKCVKMCLATVSFLVVFVSLLFFFH